MAASPGMRIDIKVDVTEFLQIADHFIDALTAMRDALTPGNGHDDAESVLTGESVDIPPFLGEPGQNVARIDTATGQPDTAPATTEYDRQPGAAGDARACGGGTVCPECGSVGGEGVVSRPGLMQCWRCGLRWGLRWRPAPECPECAASGVPGTAVPSYRLGATTPASWSCMSCGASWSAS